ncbi:DUF4124 domain-containing protein [Lamprocystis purpurea]|uniref:DUF4124 domain-containing protein n=1 Tax=Lamprocystis purpurea TaxID=61598 RepID=UPI0024803F81|nr:DUF4124 domain-containing protein [Lamprocystis purpurea]
MVRGSHVVVVIARCSTRRGPGSRSHRWALGLVVASIGLAAFSSQSVGEMYRWVDESGTTVYAQQPPPGITATPIKPDPTPRADTTGQAVEQLRGLVEQDIDKREDQSLKAEEAAKQATEQAARKTNCDAARKNLDTLENHGRGRLRTPDGKSKFFSKEELAKEFDKAREQIKANCR